MGKRISQLNALSSASLNTTLVGIDNGVTYKITLDVLEDAVINMLSASTDARLDFLETFSSSFNSFSASLDNRLDNVTIDTSSLATKTSFNTFTQSYQTDSASFDSRISSHISGTNYISESYNEFVTSYHAESSSFSSRIEAATNEQFIAGLLLTSSFNSYTASISTASLVNRLNAIESVSGSWITESETGSFLTSLNGAISSSAQILSGSGIVSGATQITAMGYAKLVGGNTFYSEQTFTNKVNFQNTLSASVIDSLNTISASYLTFTQSYYSDSASFNSRIISGSVVAGTISSSAQITEFGFITGVIDIDNYVTTASYEIDSASFSSRIDAATNEQDLSYLVTTSSLNNLSTSVDSRLDLLESFSSSADGRYVLSGSITQTTWDNIENKPAGIISSSGQISGLGFATTSSLQVVSASAWGAFQSASSYSASFYSTINNLSASIYLTDSTQSNNITNNSSSFATSISASNFNITNNSASAATALNTFSASIYLTDVTQSNNIATLSASLFSISGSSATLTSNNIFTGTNVFSGSTYFSGSVIFEDSREVIVLQSGFGTGTTNFDINSGSTFYVNGLTGNGTWNIQNFVSSSQRVTPITFVVEQGATAYSASAYTLGGTAVTVKWQNGSTPVGLASKTDVFALSVFRSGSTFNVLGSYSTFG